MHNKMWLYCCIQSASNTKLRLSTSSPRPNYLLPGWYIEYVASVLTYYCHLNVQGLDELI